MKLKKILKPLCIALVIITILANLIAAVHAYKFTHFSDSNIARTKPEQLSRWQKLKTLFTGISNPRPENQATPTQEFETIMLQSNKKIACWSIRQQNAKGTVIIFHGYSGEKSSMLDKSDALFAMGYNTLLVDFMGSGGSEGNQTTIGYHEAAQVKTAYEYLVKKGEKNIVLFGTSMGAAAILKAMHDGGINPAAIIIECPFGTMYQTVCARFNAMNTPTFPMAPLLVLWGGLENGFWAFSHNPETYAKAVNCPTLLLYGEKDKRVTRKEINAIYNNLPGKKQLKTYPNAGHENYLLKYKSQWISDIRAFLAS